MSSRSGSLSSSHVVECRSSDPAATLCAFLMARRGWSCARISEQLNVPSLVVEECIRNGASSAALRSQLANWVAEARDDAVPPALARALLDAAPPPGAAERLEAGDPFAELDPVTQAHFAALGASVGQSFISLLNDPRPAAEPGAHWGAWLGGFVAAALDYGDGARRAQSAAGAAESSDALLALYSLPEDYSAYLQLVSGPYNKNREEGRLAAAASAGSPSSVSPPDGLSWPVGTPPEFFSASYDAATEVRLLQEGDPAGCADAALLTTETFAEDFKVIEARMKELREWEDAVERCLLQHVQSRSEEFFAASQDFGNRAAEARATTADVQRTRVGVIHHGSGLVAEMMNIARLYRSRNNLGTLCEIVGMIAAVSSQVAALSNWAALPERDMTELPAVIEAFAELQNVLATGLVPRRDVVLTDIAALGNVPQHIVRIKESLSSMVLAEVEAVLVPCMDPGNRGDVEDGRVSRALIAAAGMHLWNAALQRCREETSDALWAHVRETFIAFMMSRCQLSDRVANDILSTAVHAQASREEKLTLLGHSNVCRFPVFMDLMGAVSDAVFEFVTQAVQRWGSVLVESAVLKSTDSSGQQDQLSMEESTRRYLTSLCAAAETAASLLLEVRSHGKTPTNVRELETLVALGSRFLSSLVRSVETVLSVCSDDNISSSVRQCVLGKQMKAAITRLAKEHFRTHHATCLEKLRATVEDETWKSEDSVDAAYQLCVDTICCSDVAALAAMRWRAVFVDLSEPNGEPNGEPSTGPSTESNGEAQREERDQRNGAGAVSGCAQRLVLPIGSGAEGRVVSRSLLILVELLREYDDYLARFPFLAFDVLSRVYDLLRFYVSQCAALLLGAMAVESGVLRTITAQHMAVASQNLAVVRDGIPLMRRRWLRAAGSTPLPPTVAEDMERVRRDCAMYRCELFRNIAGLVQSKVVGLGVVPAVQWRVTGNEWVMAMLREVARLMRALRPLLPPGDIRGVVLPLLGTFARMVREVTSSPGIDGDLRAAMLSDVLLFKANVERFGFDVLRCAALYNDTATALAETPEISAKEEEVVAWFFTSGGR